MKKFLLFVSIFLFSLTSVNADDLNNIPYKALKNGAKISIRNDVWTKDVNKNTQEYFIKIVPDSSVASDYYKQDGSFAFSTGCEYDFINHGSLIGYSNEDLKFYDFTFINNELFKRELTEDEVQELFPNFKIIKITDFSKSTNSLKFKKHHVTEKIILLNDTDMSFFNYSFSTGNSKFDKYTLKGFLDIKKRGMIQFSQYGDKTNNTPWFIILIR